MTAPPLGGHTVRLVVASRAGVPPALPRMLLVVLQQELRQANLRAAPVGEPGSKGTLAIVLEPIQPPGGRLVAPRPTRDATRTGPPRTPPLRLQVRRLGADGGTTWTRRMARCCSARAFGAVRAEVRRQLGLLRGAPLPGGKALWPGSIHRHDALQDRLLAGLRWLLHRALAADAFALSDYQQVFLILSRSARDPDLRRLGQEVGRELGQRFLHRAPLATAQDDPGRLHDLVAGLYFARRFGLQASGRFERALRRAVQNAGPRLIARDVPRSPARRLLDDVVDLYFLHRLGLPSPKPYAAVIREARRAPWTLGPGETVRTLEDRVYLATHVIYALSDFAHHRLREADVAPLVSFLASAAAAFLAAGDLETLGEVADTLKIVGRGYGDPLLRRVLERLLTSQNRDGSWGNPREKRDYVRYHTTWTAVNGLLEYRFRGEGPQDPVIRRAWRDADSPARP